MSSGAPWSKFSTEKSDPNRDPNQNKILYFKMLVLIYQKLGLRAVMSTLSVGVYARHLQKEKDVAYRIYLELCSQPE